LRAAVAVAVLLRLGLAGGAWAAAQLLRHKRRKADAYLREVFRLLPGALRMPRPMRAIVLWRAAVLCLVPAARRRGMRGAGREAGRRRWWRWTPHLLNVNGAIVDLHPSVLRNFWTNYLRPVRRP
jgi:hypothetical protein